ncbi:MAG: hypothetical protein GX821_09805 [Clostridiaceae bacterium]|jgi:hypothetical protein|nr:hypothetical protein [Eubacteriales bacterium]MDD4744551.1 hypothetical protein [Eubacteriales bacterium]NLB45441.1 hypothetical protein [Clostridiaceae bacterium]
MTAGKDIAQEFSRIMRECRGKVTFVTEEGDRLVADSMLSALVGLSTLLTIAEEVSLHVDCEYPEDCERIMGFMTKHRLDKHP